LPTMLKYLDASKLDENQKAALNTLKKWNKFFDADSEGAAVFAGWWSRFYQATWNDNFSDKSVPLNWPSMDRTEELLLKEPNSVWFDNKKTPMKENAIDVLSRSFNLAVDALISKGI